MSTKRLALSLVFLTFIALSGCSSSKELTRGKAKDIIENSETLRSGNHAMILSTKEFNDGVKLGYLAMGRT